MTLHHDGQWHYDIHSNGFSAIGCRPKLALFGLLPLIDWQTSQFYQPTHTFEIVPSPKPTKSSFFTCVSSSHDAMS